MAKEFKEFKIEDFLANVKPDSLVEFDFGDDEYSDGIYKGIDQEEGIIFLQHSDRIQHPYHKDLIKGYRIK